MLSFLFMNQKFNKNAKVEKLTKVVLSHGEEKGLIVKDPLKIVSLEQLQPSNESNL